jgi:desulfoferrodoxin-like iron-binding protein
LTAIKHTFYNNSGSHNIYQKGDINMANELGKRYVCSKCGAEFIVTKAGDGTIHCCGQPMELKK